MDEINRRTLISGLGATGLAIGLSRKSAFAQERVVTGSHQGDYSRLARDCIKACSDCHNECVAATQYCLKMGGEHVNPEHLRLLEDCAELCALAARFMLGYSEFDKKLCALCAELCERCAKSCDRFEGDQNMQRCATVCRECADVCKQFVLS